MANEIDVTVAGKETVSKTFQDVGKAAGSAEKAIVGSMENSSKSTEGAAKAGDKLSSVWQSGNNTANRFADGVSGIADGIQAVSDTQNHAARAADEYRRKENDVQQAMEDVQQAARDLKQAQLDLNQSTLDGKQSQIDFEQALADKNQAMIDAQTAQKDYNDAVKEHGKDSTEAQQALQDLKQSQIDLKQAELDSSQAISDQAQATEDGEQSQRDANQATIDAKGAQLDLNEAQRQAVPASDVQNWSSALGAATPILLGVSGAVDLLTLATNALTASWIKNTAGAIAAKVAQVAGAVATGVMTAAQWLLNVALTANPIGLIIVAIGLLIAGIVLLWTHSSGFRDFFIGMWSDIWGFLKVVGGWFAGPFASFFVNWFHTTMGALNDIKNVFMTVFNFIRGIVSNSIDFMTGLPGKIKAAFSVVGDYISAPFRAGFNAISRAWNNTVGRLSWTIPDWVPGIGGNGISAPRLPTAATGADVLRTGAMLVHKGERVVPASKAGFESQGSGGAMRLVIDLSSAPRELRRWIKSMTKLYGGGGPSAVQIAWAGDTS